MFYIRVVQLLDSCGPLFKIIRVCGPQSAKNTYFRQRSSKKKKRSSLGIGLRNSYFCPKSHSVLRKKKKKGLHLESVSTTLGSLSSARHSLLYKVVAACDRQDLCKIVPRARSWTTLFYIINIIYFHLISNE